MPETKLLKKGITRRSFLKTSAAVAGVAAISSSMVGCNSINTETGVSGSAEERIFSGACRANCFGGCRLLVHVRDEHIVKTSMGPLPDPAYNRICAKGLSQVQRVYDNNRVKYPIRRVGDRGKGQWERISWDEAIDEISTKWKDYQERFGKESILFCGNSGNFGWVDWKTPSRLQAYMGASSVYYNMDEALVECSINALGYGLMMNSNEYTDRVNSKTILIWGANPTEAQIHNWHFLAEARKTNGAKIIVIDPNYTIAASKADIYVPLRPGTDAALALGMLNHIIKNDWIDEQFLKKSTVAPLLTKVTDGTYLRMSDLGVAPTEGPISASTGKPAIIDPFVVVDSDTQEFVEISKSSNPAILGSYSINGIDVRPAYDLLVERIDEYPPNWASDICDVPVDTITKIAEIFAKETPSSIYQQYGLDRYVNAHYGILSIYTLAMVTGNVGKPGACCGITGGSSTYLNSNAVAKPTDSTPGRVIAHCKIPDVLESNEYAGKPLTIKSIFVFHTNPITVFADRTRFTKAVDAIEYLVVAEYFMSDTAQYADIVLPAAYWFEVDDMAVSTNTGYLELQEKAIEPLYESKPDHQIVKLLADKLGLGSYFDYSPEEYMNMALNTDSARALNVTYDRLMKEKVVRGLPKDPVIHGASGVYPTTTTRLQFYFEKPAVTSNYGQTIDVRKEQLPILFEPPHEAWHENPLYDKYPLSCYFEHGKWRVHTQWNKTSWLREIDPEPVAKLSDIDAKARGIVNGDTIKVFNDRGFAVLKVCVSNAIRPGMVNIPHGWQEDQYIDGHYQYLTSDYTDPTYVNNYFNDTLVEVEKYSK